MVNSQLTPPCRKLRIFAFDPSLGQRLDTAAINITMVQLPWEDLWPKGGRPVEVPIGEYLEIIDYDAAMGCHYKPLNFNDRIFLAMDGYDPSEGNPLFHQQMVYAVTMRTIRAFEHALGRPIAWSDRQTAAGWEPTPRLKIYPHGMMEANAFYDPDQKRLIFGYFRASREESASGLPGELTFTCLSHDILAHETTHAILDGLHRNFIEDSNPDMLAFHEAFADIVALLNHFSIPDVVSHQIAQTGGNLEALNLMGCLAQQFGQAIGGRGALRSYLGRENPETGQWEPLAPDPFALSQASEPHTRGAILVAAVFQAYLKIYKSHVADLYRLAGSQALGPKGELHPDLIKRLSQEAARVAGRVLTMCIRALDYCPPVDLTFGEFLRALITADYEMVPDDQRHYRAAFIESFRAWGIFPEEISVMSESSLLWQSPRANTPHLKKIIDPKAFQQFQGMIDRLDDIASREDRHLLLNAIAQEIYGLINDLNESRSFTPAEKKKLFEGLGLCLDLKTLMPARRTPQGQKICNELDDFQAIKNSTAATVQVHRACLANRNTPTGDIQRSLIITMSQRRKGSLNADVQRQADEGKIRLANPDFYFHGGCTLVIDTRTLDIRYAIYKSVANASRLEKRRKYEKKKSENGLSLRGAYFVNGKSLRTQQPFAHLHGLGED